LTLIGARLVGSHGHVVAYEPVPSTAAAVRHNARLNGFDRVEVVEAAVAGTPGVLRLALADSSLEAELSPVGDLEVSAVTIDAEVATGRPAPTVMKIDVEGAEAVVLEGAAQVLRERRPVVVCEIHEALHARVHPAERLLKEAGYSVRWLERGVPGRRPRWAPHLAAFPPGHVGS
jgi:FkbM family methyltransferase